MNDIKQVIEIIEDLKVKDLKAYDFEKASPFYDYFIIATVNDRQAAAVANNLKKNEEIVIKGVEGKGSGWLLIDLGNIVIHLFNQTEREFYDFDRRMLGIKRV